MDDLLKRYFSESLRPLTEEKRWVAWRWKKKKDGKQTKIPIQPWHPYKNAETDDPSTWGSWAQAKQVTASAGTGYVLTNGEIAAFDIDNCRNPETGVIDPWAMELVTKANSYTEITPSKTGLRIIGRGTGSYIHRKQPVANGVSLESFRKATRFITISWDVLPGFEKELANLDALMEETVAALDGMASKSKSESSNNDTSFSDDTEYEDIKPDDQRLAKLDPKWIALGYEGKGMEQYKGHRSKAVMAFACECVRAGVDVKILAACLMRWKIGEHIRNQSNVKRALNRAIERGRLFVEDSKLFEMNELHAVLSIAGKTRVATWGDDPDFPGRQTILSFSGFGDFKALHDKYRYTFTGKDKKGDPEQVTMGVGTWWLSQPHRRQYEGGKRFMPNRDEDVVGNIFNLWQGFAVAPRKPEGKSGAAGCGLLLDHGLKIICSGNEDHFNYLMKREAVIAQKRIRSEVAVALRTEEEGTGKETWCGAFRHLYGVHGMQIQNPEHIVGKHNEHLEMLLRLTADEALFAGDPRQRNALYNLITEPRLTLEPKFVGVYTAPNFLNCEVISNDKRFIPVSGTARRFMVPTVSSIRANDHAYFKNIKAQLIDDGGYEALLYHLLYEIDVSDFNVRDVPKTAGLLDQKLLSGDPEQRWWLDMLMRGELPSGCSEANQCPTDAMFDAYIKHAQRQNARRRSIQTELGMFLNRMMPDLRKTKGLYKVIRFSQEKNRYCQVEEYGPIYILPTLTECREAFAKGYQQSIAWPEDGGKWTTQNGEGAM